MRIEALRVVNYKSFADSGEIRFKAGFNVVVGRNNVGKTALAEAMGMNFTPNPHRSQRTVPIPGTQPDPHSRVEVTFKVEADELMRVLTDELPEFYVPTVRSSESHTEAWLFSSLSDGATIHAIYTNADLLSVRLVGFPEQASTNEYLGFRMDPSVGHVTRLPGVTVGPLPQPDLMSHLANTFRGTVYGFRAVRFGIDEYPIGPVRELSTDAANLVQTLDLLSGNPSRWRRFFNDVRTVLPELEAMTFVPSERGGVPCVRYFGTSIPTPNGKTWPSPSLRAALGLDRCSRSCTSLSPPSTPEQL